MLSFIRMLRLPNVLLIIAFFVLGDVVVLDALRERLGVPAHLTWIDRTLYVLDLLLITWFGYWLNDLHDQAADRINRPERPLSSEQFQPSLVRSMAWGAFVAGMLICIYLGVAYGETRFIWIYPVVGVLLWLYARYGKPMGLIGNVVVSLLIAALPSILILPELELMEQWLEAYPTQFSVWVDAVVNYIGLVFLINLAREVVKDMEDEEGDRVQAGRSLVILIGQMPTAWIVVFLLLMVIALQLRLQLMLGSTLSGWLITAIVTGLSALVVMLLVSNLNARRLCKASSVLKLIMLIGVLELILFRGLL